MSLALLADNDIVIKLAQMDAYVDGINALGYTTGSVGSLGVMLRYMGLVDETRRLALTTNQAQADRLGAALNSIVIVELTDLESSLSAQVMKVALQNELDLQEGELALIVVAASRGSLDVLTGDKRALRSLPALAECWKPVLALMGRFLCFEHVFKQLFKGSGIARVTAAVYSAPEADRTVKAILDETKKHGASAFLALINLVVKEQIETPAPGWLKAV